MMTSVESASTLTRPSILSRLVAATARGDIVRGVAIVAQQQMRVQSANSLSEASEKQKRWARTYLLTAMTSR
jgi:hypothetical protein